MQPIAAVVVMMLCGFFSAPPRSQPSSRPANDLVELMETVPPNARPDPQKGWDEFSTSKMLDWTRSMVRRQATVQVRTSGPPTIHQGGSFWTVSFGVNPMPVDLFGGSAIITMSPVSGKFSEDTARKLKQLPKDSVLLATIEISHIKFTFENGRQVYFVDHQNIKLDQP